MTKTIALPGGRHQPSVYFIRLGTCVKIGYTTNIRSRVSGLSLHPSFVVLLIEGDRSIEADLHRRFERDRLSGTEWFRYSKQVHAYVVSHQGRNTHELPDGESVDVAIRLVRETKWASVSMLQRRMLIGFNRASGIMNQLELRGVVGPPQGSRVRQILPDELTPGDS